MNGNSKWHELVNYLWEHKETIFEFVLLILTAGQLVGWW